MFRRASKLSREKFLTGIHANSPITKSVATKYGAQSASLTGPTPSMRRKQTDVATNCATGVGVPCCRMSRSCRSVVEMQVKKAANGRVALTPQRRNSCMLGFLSALWLQSDRHLNGRLPHPPQIRCRVTARVAAGNCVTLVLRPQTKIKKPLFFFFLTW